MAKRIITFEENQIDTLEWFIYDELYEAEEDFNNEAKKTKRYDLDIHRYVQLLDIALTISEQTRVDITLIGGAETASSLLVDNINQILNIDISDDFIVTRKK